ncbi:hypothetical protein SAMD00019534_030460 [Acytostelium subglobosum LB1]|uniref:hypothetical protein n=1 Tax=Acytostelium subglobosum LB1 TaxID=1410327 RepID=UPI000644BDC2|nr:hypothetical protein SAMD00019534_030460 [Acytostelium subglobosum LB1]GAM19871.1 hypothetical protein SAMD00019534_030460 [Acytostelium subglobosum LB1]|eukprot:XP_012756633.1 hypothetical protein SAMD00019534_030460 [Acytostelium subglobosum LB1]
MIEGRLLAKPDIGQHLTSPFFPYRLCTAINTNIDHFHSLITHVQSQQQQQQQQVIVNTLLSRLTRVDVFSFGATPINESNESTVKKLFGSINQSLRKITLRTPFDSTTAMDTLILHVLEHQYPHLSTISIHFLDGIGSYDSVLSLLERCAPTLTKLSFFSIFNTRHTDMNVSPMEREATTKFFERMFGILSITNSRVQSLLIKRLYFGELRPFLRGLYTMQHIKKLKLLSYSYYTRPEMDDFNTGLVEFVQTRKLTILNTPFPVGADLLTAIMSNASIVRLRITPLAMAKLPATLRSLILDNETPPTVFTTLITLNPTSNLVRLLLFEHRHYLTADNFDQFLDFMRTSKSLSTLFLGDYLFLTDEQKVLLITVLVRETSLQSLLIGMTDPEDHSMVTNNQDSIIARTTKEFDDLQYLLSQLALYPQSNIDHILFEIIDRKLFEQMMIDRHMDLGNFVFHYYHHSFAMKFHKVKQSWLQ